MSRFIASTTLSAMRSTGSAAERSLERLGAIMAREFPQGIGFELAEPVPRQDGSGIDWYTDHEEKLVRLADLPPETAAHYRSRLNQSIQAVRTAAATLEARGEAAGRTTAAALRTAVTFPGEGNVWIAGPSADESGTIILTAWGYETHDTVERGRTGEIVGSVRERLPPGVRENAGAGVLPATDRARWRPVALTLLWLVPLVLAGLTGWLLLPACGLRLPFGSIAFGTGVGAFCVLEQPVDIVDQNKVRTRELMAEVAVLQEQARRHMSSCRPEPMREVEASPEQEPIRSDIADEAEERVDRETPDDATVGEMEVTLIWNGKADLDLFAFCPDGQRVPREGSHCGGRHRVDMNFQNKHSNEPVENVIWQAAPPPGRYEISVALFGRNGDADPQIDFNVVVKKGDETRTYPGHISEARKALKIVEFDVP